MSTTETEVKSSLVLPERMNPKPLARVPAEVSPMALVQIAVQRGDSLEQINQIVALAERMQANIAKQQFNAAFAAFKAEAVRIVKSTTITDGPLKGKKHANLYDVVVAATGPLAKHGLHLSWKLTKDEPQWMEITCTVSHSGGHSESVSMGAAPDTGPGRNAIQARGSAKTYLERYTATAILGLAASAEEDDDGNSGGHWLSEEQLDTIESLIADVKPDVPALLKYAGVDAIEDIPASSYNMVVQAIRAAGKHKQKSPEKTL